MISNPMLRRISAEHTQLRSRPFVFGAMPAAYCARQKERFPENVKY